MKKLLFRLFAASTAAGMLAIFLFVLALRQPVSLPEDAVTDGRMIYTVPQGASAIRVARNLEERGIILHRFLFRGLLVATGQSRGIKAGDYAIEEGMNTIDLAERLLDGKAVQVPFTIVEGWNIRELLVAVRNHTHIEQTLPKRDPEGALMAALGHPEQHPEGRFFADTYHFTRGTRDVDLLRRAYRMTERVLAEEWAGRSEEAEVETPYEALILASIIEKETAVAAERPLIAGVFTNRLRRGMRLQTDPTVIYGIGASFDGDIRYRDLRTDTPYNTYTRAGLPPTPIAMPGRAAIHAALHPAPTEALYFVSRNDGTHIFSATLKDHEAAVDRYQRGL
ncbi:MAG: endolytic transglycosylase MltG [Pseudomonadota bacterium]